MRLVKNRHLPAVVFVIAVIIVLLVALTIIANVTNPNTGESKAITYSTGTPSESKHEADGYDWHGAAKDPKKVKIPTISVDAFIQRMGVDQNKQVAVPTNIHFSGWFNQSAQPGQQGLAIIDGHVSGRNGDGVFKNLSKLQPKDTFQVERGDGTVLTYRVMRTVSVPEKESASILFSQDPKVSSQLNLITCGKFDRATRHYQNRIIVSAELVTT